MTEYDVNWKKREETRYGPGWVGLGALLFWCVLIAGILIWRGVEKWNVQFAVWISKKKILTGESALIRMVK